MEKNLTRKPTHTPETHKKSPSHNCFGESEPDFLRRTRRRTAKSVETQKGDGDDEDDDVDEKIAALQRIVPGGESLGVDELFEETAGYIRSLQFQIKAMKVLTCLLQGLEKEKMKFGG